MVTNFFFFILKIQSILLVWLVSFLCGPYKLGFSAVKVPTCVVLCKRVLRPHTTLHLKE